jgi:hypothetical protein
LHLGVEPALLQSGDESWYCVLASTALTAAGSAVASTAPRAPLSAPPRSRPSNKPIVASSTRWNTPAWKTPH